MKKYLPLLLCIILTNYVNAQDSLFTKIKDPEFPFEPMYLDSNLSTIELPLEKYVEENKTGVGALTVSNVLSGDKSKLRLNQNKPLVFVVKQGLVNGTTANVKEMYKLYKLTVRNEKTKGQIVSNRLYMTKHADTKGSHINNDDILIKFKRVREDIYLLRIDSLLSGEYVIETKARETMLYTFGID